MLRAVLMTMASVLALASDPALAQNTQESFVPPMGNWSLPPSGQQAPEPTPTPAPQQTQTPAQPPVVVPTITPRPAPATQPRATTPQSTPTPAPRQATPAPTPAIETQPQGQAPTDTIPVPLPDVAEPTPQPLPDATPVPGTIDQPSGGLPRWLVALVALALAGGAGWFLFRRRRRTADEAYADETHEVLQPVADVEPVVPRAEPRAPIAPVPVRRVPGEVTSPAVRRAVPGAPTPPKPAAASIPVPAPAASDATLPKGLITTRIPALGRASPPPSPDPLATKPTAAPVVPLPPPMPRPRANGGGLGFILNAQRITISMTQLMLEFELIAENHTDFAVSSLDVATAMLTAHADQDAQIARFFAERPESPATALDVGPQMARGLNGKLSMPLGQVNPVETGGRSYCVPIMMIDARYTWADGREERKSVAFVLGKGAQDANKLGPIFLDRGPGVTREVGARLHTPLRKAS
ncbi:hypothetical protein [Sphingomonas sp. AX6]|uniref:hypothetical protein n=1 Tax=Sphingomonas sp. AX6 TaxID=2653171 RepID=UPI001F39C57C|nr:hypothetical protein [Sphingomonas sp. AX6]